jgi:hypothetical protein
MPKPTTTTRGGDGDDGGGNLRCLYDGDRTKPIKTMKDKFELLPAFLKVRGLGAFLRLWCSRAIAFAARGGLMMMLQAAANSRFFLLSCVVLSSFAKYSAAGEREE